MSDSVTLEELKTHGTEGSAWLAINGTVYDVTDFISRHPGGDAILEGLGKDATTLFLKIRNHGNVDPDKVKHVTRIGKLKR